MRAKRVGWTGDAAESAIIAARGGPDGVAKRFNRLSIQTALSVARKARSFARECGEISAASIAGVLMGIMIEVDTVPGQRVAKLSAARIGSHFEVGERTVRRAIDALVLAGVIRASQVRGARIEVTLLDGIDQPHECGSVLPHPELEASTDCGSVLPQSEISAEASFRTPEKVRKPATAPNKSRKRTQDTKESSIMSEMRIGSADSLESERIDQDPRARTPECAEPAPSLDDFTVESAITPTIPDQEPEPRREESKASTDPHDPEQLARTILTAEDQERMRALRISSDFIAATIGSGLTSADVRPILDGLTYDTREDWIRGVQAKREIRELAKSRGLKLREVEVVEPRRRARA